MDVVRIFDTTLRDGEQSPGFSMNTAEKIRLARQLAALNVDVIEAGFPIASRGDLEAVKKVAQEVRSVPIAALARAKKEDVTRRSRRWNRRPRRACTFSWRPPICTFA